MTDTQTPRRSRRALAYRALAMVASLAFVSVLIMTSSRAAFVDSTDNTGNSFSAGTVVLDDDDGNTGSVLFNVNNLAQYLDLTVEVGTGGSFGNCGAFSPSGGPLYTGTLANFAASRTNFTNGLAGWNGATNPSNRVYRLTVTLQDNNAAQGLSANADFTWEAQNV